MNLLATGAWALDVAFFVILAIGAVVGAILGFTKMVCKWAGVILSFVVAIGFCIAFKNTLEAWFGMTTALANAMGGNAKLADWISVAIAFVGLFLLVWLISWLLSLLVGTLVNTNAVVRGFDKGFGAVLGLAFAFVVIMIVLAIVRIIPVDSMHEFVSSSTIVGGLYRWEWFTQLLTNVTSSLPHPQPAPAPEAMA